MGINKAKKLVINNKKKLNNKRVPTEKYSLNYTYES